MIVKDEEEHIGNALSSVMGLFDEAVVVDTGSTDRTVEIAETFDARVFNMAWPGDFAAVRNESIARATGEWVFILDADETIAREDHQRIRRLITRQRAHAFQFPQRTYMVNSATMGWKRSPRACPEARGYPGYVEYFQVRLFPRLPVIRYRGPVHESLEPACREGRVPITTVDIPIHHYGKVRGGSHLVEKAKNYLDMGIKKVQQQFDSQAIFELAAQVLELNRAEEARVLCEELIDAAPEHVDALNLLGVACTKLGDFANAARTLKIAIEKAPDSPDAWNNLGIVHMAEKRYARAASCFEKSLARDRGNANAWTNLAAACAETGRFSDARNAVQRAKKLNPDLGRIRMTEAWIHVSDGRCERAKEVLREFTERDLYFTPNDILQFCRLCGKLRVLYEFEDFVRRHLTDVSRDEEVSIRLAGFLGEEGHRPLATELLQVVCGQANASARAINLLGFMLGRDELYAEALERFTQAAQKDPANPTYVQNVALACEKLGMTKVAVKFYIQLASLDPASVHYARARIMAIRNEMTAENDCPLFVKADRPITR